MPKRKIIPIETDFHAGHKAGLMHPDTLFKGDDDGEPDYTRELTTTQEFLHQLRIENVGKLLALAKRDPIYYLYSGDQVQGFKHKSRWVSPRSSDQFTIAKRNAALILELKRLQAARFIVGTQAHDGHLGSIPASLQEHYQDKYPRKDIKTIWHGLIDFSGFKVDISHHGPSAGSKTWLKGNAAYGYLKDRMLRDLDNGQTPPKVYVRGHVHEQVWVTCHINRANEWYTASLLVVPSMCGLSAYARQSTQSIPEITNGMTCLEIIDNEIHKVHWFTVTRDLRSQEYIP